jgi:hypothetical protein
MAYSLLGSNSIRLINYFTSSNLVQKPDFSGKLVST